MRIATLGATFVIAMSSPVAADPPPPESKFASAIQPFVENYCIECHGDDDPKGDRSFESLAAVISDDEVLVDYQDMLDQLNLSEMPPPEADQPNDQQRRIAIDALTDVIQQYHASRVETSNRSVIRRLNAREYRNTIRDLLDLDITIFDPTTRFPRDQRVEHLDNIGENLVTSSHLLTAYLNAAEQVIERAFYPLEKPPARTWSFRDSFRQQPEIDNVHRTSNRFKHMTLYDVVGADKPEGAYGPILAFAEGVPHDGVYEIRLRAEAVNRNHPYDHAFIGTDRDQPFRLGIVPGDATVGDLHLPQPIEPLLAELELADEPKWYTVRVPLDRGYTPRFTFRNGLMDSRNLWGKLVKKYPNMFPKGINGIVELRRNAIVHGKLPQIRIHEIEITGPILAQWPTQSQRVLFGDDFQRLAAGETIDEGTVRDHFRRFASLAYRRQASDAEVDRIMQMVEVRQRAGRSQVNAIADGFKTILCSPHFLFLDETSSDDGEPLSQHALASRISYFLWASMPDEKLRRLADEGKLSGDDAIRNQVRRLLGDPKSDAFVRGFLDSWLALNELGSAPPDRDTFRDFYRHDLGAAMRQETQMFFRHQLAENLPVENFIDSDFTFVNPALAALYGMQSPAEQSFALTAISDKRRGGLLGQASVLTVSANGIDTSPVVRGVWMLENFLGTPPSPPPPDVEPLDPDTRGAKTIRDQLSKHRDVATCYDCHRKIDPLGFALENYDPIGKWRNAYARNAKIDPSGELPDGKPFQDIRDLKRILLTRKSQFTRSMATKMLAYANGRLTVPGDRPDIEKIASSAKGTRDLVEAVVLSQPFRTK
ncbi:DUF1592 domain-containing protein [Rubripirellula tenax]|nr:DUF1592 domain-containing protein [Rubripirellula tenax]